MKKGFLINRRDSFITNGNFSGFILENEKLLSERANSYYNSFSLDSNESDMTWQRMVIKSNISQQTRMNICIYSSETLMPSMEAMAYFKAVGGVNGESKSLDQMLSELTPERGNKLISTISKITRDNTSDILLYGLKGRYIWFSLALYSYEKHLTSIDSILMEFPRISFTEYLPQIYRKDPDGFMARFIAIFQSVYVDIETQITNMPNQYKLQAANEEFLNWIALWFGIKGQHIWKEEKLRSLLGNIIYLSKCKGTVASIRYIVKLLIDVDPIIIERFHITSNEFYQNNRKTMDNLFGDNDYVFTMIISSKGLNEVTKFMELLKAVKGFTPIEMICNPVILEERIYLNHHCYLGINTTLYENQGIILDERNSL